MRLGDWIESIVAAAIAVCLFDGFFVQIGFACALIALTYIVERILGIRKPHADRP